MEPLVDTVIEDDRWEEFGLAPLAEAAARATLVHLGLEPAGFEISLMGCDDARIAALNADFRDKPRPTNVLSWPSEERAAEDEGGEPEPPEPFAPGIPEGLGDIAIAYETCAREAQEKGIPVADHATHLIVHGLLHLAGYDHEADSGAMRRKERVLRKDLGIA